MIQRHNENGNVITTTKNDRAINIYPQTPESSSAVWRGSVAIS